MRGIPNFFSLIILERSVESLSLSKAADQAHIALSAASRRIGLLEDQFGVQLLNRLPGGGIEPTPAGLALAAHVKLLVRSIDQLTRDMDDYAHGAQGHVRVHANVSAMARDLPQRLSSFVESNKKIKLEIKEGRSLEVVKSLKEGHADIGVVVGDGLLTDLEYALYGNDRLCAVVPKRHPITRTSISIRELLDYDFVGFDNNAAITSMIRIAATSAGVPLRLRVTVQSYEAACRMIECGFGIAVMPENAAKTYLHALNLRFITLTDNWATRRMYVCIDPSNDVPPVRALYNALIQKD